MDEKKLTRLLHVNEPTAARRGWGCADDMQLAAFTDHRLSPTEEARIESHLSGCARCLEQVAFLVRQPAAGEGTVAPPLLSLAKDLVPSRPSIWRSPVVRWGPVVAAAACLVLVVSLQLRQSGGPTPPAALSPASAPGAVPATAPVTTPLPSASTPARGLPGTTASPAPTSPAAPTSPRAALRNSVTKPLSLVLMSPAENSTVSSRDVEFRWREVPGAIYYEVHIVTEEGNVVWQGKVEGTSTRLPSGHPLQADTRYFVWVRAYLSGGGTVKSAAVAFRVGGV